MLFRRFGLVVLLISIALQLMGCSGSHYAPVRTYYRDIPKSKKYYIVQKGDTLYAIGVRSGYGYKQLVKWNGLSPPYRLFIGQKIKLFKSEQRDMGYDKKHLKNKGIKKTRNLSQKKPLISNDKKKVLKFNWQWPIKGKILRNFSQTGNKGIDISGKLGQAVKAAASGKVVYSGHGLMGYGNLLIIKHNSSYLSAYANNHRLLVKEGQRIKKGQVIAEVGKVRGAQTSLHFEIRKKGKPVNPVNYLPKK